ncbi:MAG: hypothetical protein HY815_28995 [Candidatus Riflebacteria bacterium]|nr:hypothetical protein [Candidatus Riflebacteria bacterium]
MHFSEKVVYLFHRRGRCSEPGCQSPFYAKGLCRNHYRRWMKGTLEPTEDPSREVWRAKLQNQ